ncbi:MAG: sulfite exporter TauE/SafE family protein [Deltaproteobacteria bacterium]|nr:sulfite exporter TauE/SafE family protein [Deltaproteobacteria bacterium]
MLVSPAQLALLMLSSFAAGAVNSVAGGGSLLTFPALLGAGLSALGANATSTVALMPGSFAALWGYRARLRGQGPVIAAMTVPSLVGGVLGAVLALRVGERWFALIVPWLLLGATLLFALQQPLRAMADRMSSQSPDRSDVLSARSLVVIGLFQLLVATYGGFFGAGIGIMMLASLAIVGFSDIHQMNGLKNLAAAVINAVAIVIFVSKGTANLPLAAVMALAAIAGGRLGAGIAQRLGAKTVRGFVTFVGLSITTLLFVRRMRGG